MFCSFISPAAFTRFLLKLQSNEMVSGQRTEKIVFSRFHNASALQHTKYKQALIARRRGHKEKVSYGGGYDLLQEGSNMRRTALYVGLGQGPGSERRQWKGCQENVQIREKEEGDDLYICSFLKECIHYHLTCICAKFSGSFMQGNQLHQRTWT